MSLIVRNLKHLKSGLGLLEKPKVIQQCARQMGKPNQWYWRPIPKNHFANKKPRMVVVLQQDHEKLGRKGDIIQVKRGYGRNILIPQGIADYASDEQIRMVKRREAGLLDEVEDVDSDGKRRIADPKLLPRLESLLLTVERPKDEPWEITEHHLAREFRRVQIHVPVGCMKLSEPINSFGDYIVEVTVNKSVTVPVKMTVKEWEPKYTEEWKAVLFPETNGNDTLPMNAT